MFAKIHAVATQVNQIVVGKELQVRQALVCILAGGHLLIEDVPGVGKTTLAHALAISLGLKFNRVQFTSDLLPADVVGISIFDREKNGFLFHPGPI
ncbi:MAG: AAA family ATPase, partial [Burkholderiaceae bacterium]